MRWWLVAALVCVALSGCGFAAWWIAAERARNAQVAQGLEAAERGECDTAVRLLQSALGRDARDQGGQVAFALWVCELERGGPNAERFHRMASVERTPADKRLALASARRMLQAHRYARAESLLRAAIGSDATRDSVEARQSLALLLKIEGRLQAASDTFRAGLGTLPDPIVAMREIFDINYRVYPIDQMRKTIDLARDAAPDDAGVVLAAAHLDLLSGNPADAKRRLNQPFSRADIPVELSHAIDQMQRRLDVTLDDRPSLVEHLRHAAEGVIEPREQALLWSEIERMHGDNAAEREALVARTQIPPVDFEALERLAELDARAGRDADARRWADEKAALQKALEEYRDLLFFDPDPVSKALQLATLAQKIGLCDEAREWLTLGLRRNPGDAQMRAMFQAPAERVANVSALPNATRLASRLESRASSDATAPALPNTAPDITFDDVTEARGPHFQYNSGRKRGRHPPETTGGGLAVFDFDRDGWYDIFAVQAGPFPQGAPNGQGGRLFRNLGDGRFEDVTERAGAFGGGYGMGVTVGDIDNDGWPDLFITRWRAYALFRNKGDGTFEDVTTLWGLGGDRDWPSSAAFADIDNDGDLDLYVCHYIVFDEANPMGTRPGRAPDTQRYNNPLNFVALPDHLLRNDGGHFEDISAQAGITAVDTDGRGLGVLAADFDADGLIDFYVANDLTANFMFHNKGDGTFQDVAETNGSSGSAEGLFQGSMGLACADVDRDGELDIAVTNFYGDSMALYRGLGHGLYADHTAAFGLKAPTRYMVGWGMAFHDFDNDGYVDLVMTNGHLDDPQDGPAYAMPNQLFKGRGAATMLDLTGRAGAAFAQPRVGRALATGDFDNDGRVDFIVGAHDAPTAQFLNSTKTTGHWIVLELQGTASNRDAVGTDVVARAGTILWHTQRAGGGSYQSASDPRLHFGLGSAASVDELRLRWPSGRVDTFRDVAGDRAYRAVEGQSQLTPIPQFQK